MHLVGFIIRIYQMHHHLNVKTKKVSLLSLYWLPYLYRKFRSSCAVPFVFIFFTLPSVVI